MPRRQPRHPEDAPLLPIAAEVGKLIADPRVLTRFREMVRAAYGRYYASSYLGTLTQKAELDHVEGLLESSPLFDARMLDHEAGPPHEGWAWQFFCSYGIHGWGPPTFLPRPRPSVTDHSEVLPDYYDRLSLVHDTLRPSDLAIRKITTNPLLASQPCSLSPGYDLSDLEVALATVREDINHSHPILGRYEL